MLRNTKPVALLYRYRTEAPVYLAQAALTATAVFLFLHGWVRNFQVPLAFSSDALVALSQSKSTVDNGWWWFNPLIGAPLGFDALAFPANSNVDQAIVWLTSRVVSDPLTAINLAWVTMIVLSSVTATWCARLLGASAVTSVVAGSLFAMSPFALYRNIEHIWTVTYLVPFASAAALTLALGRDPLRFERRGQRLAVLAGCGLLGFNYVYYAFFACFLLVVGSAIGYARARDRRVLIGGSLCLALVSGCTLVNLTPSLYSWQQHGRPMILRDKVPAESEVYGLKIRQLVSPVFTHPFWPLRRWAAKESAAAFPLETENMTSRLGTVGTVGFLGLLGLLFLPAGVAMRPDSAMLRAAGQLTLAAVLLGTIGGFGSLFSLLVSADIRAYNRIAPFIAYFSLIAVALALDAWAPGNARRTVAAIGVLALGLGDQAPAASGMNAQYAESAAELPGLKAVVQNIERRLPAGAMIFQLPLRTYLNDGGVGRMKAYDHLKPYLVSRTLRWSYPAFSNEQVRWQQAASRLKPNRLAAQLSAQGFAAILVDRYGYDDQGTSVIEAVRATVPDNAIVSQSERYVVFDIRAAERQPLQPWPDGTLTTSMQMCDEPPVMNLELVEDHQAPFTSAIGVEADQSIRLAGWAIDRPGQAAAAGVDVVIDGEPASAIYGLDRSDVAAHYAGTQFLQSGFAAIIPADAMSKGPHVLSLRVVSATRPCYYKSPDVQLVAH